MVSLRSRRLESVFGSPLGSLTAESIRRLVSDHVQEAFDLDFKATAYGRGDSDKRALAGDVAAMADTAGGVIVLGVAEGEQAEAMDTPGVDVTDDEVRRILQAVASNVAPTPDFDTIQVVDESLGDSNRRGFLVIAVPRSPNTPHAVMVNESLRYPRRNGPTTRYLAEPEVAAAYRDRFAGASRQQERSEEVAREGLGRVDLARDPWLLVTLVPDLPGHFLVSAASLNEFAHEARSMRPILGEGGTSFVRTGVGPRRLRADDGMSGVDSRAHWVMLELHVDGSGAYGEALMLRIRLPSLSLMKRWLPAW